MVCCCIFCAGEGFCSNLLSIVVSLTFSFHALGIASPYWMCRGNSCSLAGIYYTCEKVHCIKAVPDAGILTLAIITLVSSFALSFLFCCILHCSSYGSKKLTPIMSLFIGSWYIIQETLSLVIIILLHSNYTQVGWSAYVFTIPGLILIAVVGFMLFYMWCFPKNTINQSY